MKNDNQLESEWLGMLDFVLKIKNCEELNQFFNLFVTAEEKRDLINRYLIIKQLIKGEKTQRQIAKDLNVSIAKITRGSNFLKTIPAEFIQYIKKRIG